MPTVDNQNRPDSNLDLACTRCRERKIRCGRERPQCRNCKRMDCVYQNPVKRVNHLKLLCDSVGQLQDRLHTIESHLSRLSGPMSQGKNMDDTSSAVPSRQSSRGVDDDSEDNADRGDKEDGDDDDDISSESTSSVYAANSADLRVFRNHIDMVVRYHGPSSLFVLCNHFRLRALATHGMDDTGALQGILQNLCEIAGSTEPFPSYSDQVPIQLLPKQQAVTAVGHFVQHVDCTTDIFVPRNLMANLERVYSRLDKPGDDAWAICFKVITLLVLGMEISTQALTALVSDFARSLLPSRAALVSSRLLTTPRLINVQTLILLSVAAQQFDPPEWAELLMTHACILARTMGLHHADMLPPEGSSDDTVERTKVLKSLYTRDKSLCTTRGSVSWLPSYDCNITSHLRAAVERQAPYADQLRLAIIQDEIYRVAHCSPGSRPRSSNKRISSALQSIEQQLDEYAHASGIASFQLPRCQRDAQVELEFLATRLLALQPGSDARHAQELQSNARASCFLLLIAHGNQSPEVVNAFYALTGRTAASAPTNHPPPIVDSTIPFGSILDSFSVPAFFILLEGLLSPTENDLPSESLPDLDLLRRVSACYTERTGRMQSNSYHRQVSLIFDRLIAILDMLKNNQLHNPGLVPTSTNMSDPIASPLSPQSPSIRPPSLDSNVSTVSQRDLSSMSPWHTPPLSTSMSWDNWLSVPLSLAPTISQGGTNMESIPGAISPDSLTQALSSRQFPDCSDQMQWSMGSPDSGGSRKRPRNHEGSEISAEKHMTSPLSNLLTSTEEMPFHLIS